MDVVIDRIGVVRLESARIGKKIYKMLGVCRIVLEEKGALFVRDKERGWCIGPCALR